MQIEEILNYLEETGVTVEDIPDFGDNWICFRTLNIELDRNDMENLLLHSDFKYLQIIDDTKDNGAFINLIFVRR